MDNCRIYLANSSIKETRKLIYLTIDYYNEFLLSQEKISIDKDTILRDYEMQALIELIKYTCKLQGINLTIDGYDPNLIFNNKLSLFIKYIHEVIDEARREELI